MKSIQVKLVCELIKNSRKSDRDLAKIIGVSQPTVTRMRKNLEKEGIVSYTGSVDLKKLGFEMIAITFGNLKKGSASDISSRTKRGEDFLKKHPEIIFFTTGSGLSADRVAVSIHKNYSDYSTLISDLRTDWTDIIVTTGSFLISLDNDNVLRQLSLRYIADCLEKENWAGKPATR